MTKSFYKNRISWARWETPDPFNPQMWTAYTVSIYKPSYDNPHITIIYSMSNGGGRCFNRYTSLAHLKDHHVIPDQYYDRLHQAETYALQCLDSIKEDIANLGKIRKGVIIADYNTGEIL